MWKYCIVTLMRIFYNPKPTTNLNDAHQEYTFSKGHHNDVQEWRPWSTSISQVLWHDEILFSILNNRRDTVKREKSIEFGNNWKRMKINNKVMPGNLYVCQKLIAIESCPSFWHWFILRTQSRSWYFLRKLALLLAKTDLRESGSYRLILVKAYKFKITLLFKILEHTASATSRAVTHKNIGFL